MPLESNRAVTSLVLPATRHVAPLPSLLAQIGNTPLLRLANIGRDCPGVELYAKAEWFNPGGSVKDRAALNMVLEGERCGELRPSKIILDSTSGNTGIAYAMIGAARGYCVRLCVPSNVSPERKRILRAYGADVIFTPAAEGSDGAIRVVRQLFAENPEQYFFPDQYNNPANYDPALADENIAVKAEDAYAMVKRLAREEGILVGVSGAAAAVAALSLARRVRRGVIVTVFPDSADKYLSEAFWETGSEVEYSI